MHTASASLGPMRRVCRASASREPRTLVPSPGSEVFPRVDWTRCRTCSCWRMSRRCCAARRRRSRDDCARTSFLYRRCPRSTSGRGGARRPCCGGSPTEDPNGHAREEGRRERGPHAGAEVDCGDGTKGTRFVPNTIVPRPPKRLLLVAEQVGGDCQEDAAKFTRAFGATRAVDLRTVVEHHRCCSRGRCARSALLGARRHNGRCRRGAATAVRSSPRRSGGRDGTRASRCRSSRCGVTRRACGASRVRRRRGQPEAEDGRWASPPSDPGGLLTFLLTFGAPMRRFGAVFDLI